MRSGLRFICEWKREFGAVLDLEWCLQKMPPKRSGSLQLLYCMVLYSESVDWHLGSMKRVFKRPRGMGRTSQWSRDVHFAGYRCGGFFSCRVRPIWLGPSAAGTARGRGPRTCRPGHGQWQAVAPASELS